MTELKIDATIDINNLSDEEITSLIKLLRKNNEPKKIQQKKTIKNSWKIRRIQWRKDEIKRAKKLWQKGKTEA
jgi:hypothetical protein